MFKKLSNKILICFLCILCLNAVFQGHVSYARQNKVPSFELPPPLIAPLVAGEEVTATFFFEVKKTIETHDWMKFRFSWKDAFPFINDKPPSEEIHQRLAYCYFHPSVYCPSCMAIMFEDASTLTISVPQRFQENTVYSFSFWKEFGLTLPKDPGNYQVEWKSFREKDWQVIATFTLEAPSDLTETFSLTCSESNYRMPSDITIQLKPKQIEQWQGSSFITLAYPAFYSVLAISEQGLKPPLLDLPKDCVRLNEQSLQARLEPNKTLKIAWPDSLDASQRYTLTIQQNSMLLNAFPGKTHFWIGSNDHWIKSGDVVISADKIPLRVYYYKGLFGFKMEYYHPPEEGSIDLQKITVALPEECYASNAFDFNNPKTLPKLNVIPLHHMEKYLRNYMVFIREKARYTQAGKVYSYSFWGDKNIRMPSDPSKICITFRLNDSCFHTTSEALVYYIREE